MNKKHILPLIFSLILLSAFSWLLVLRHEHRFDARGFEKTSAVEGLFNALEWNWYDFKFQNSPTTHAKKVIVAKIDDASLARFGRWPWSRNVYRDILRELYDNGAEVVGFDAVFSEPEFDQNHLEFLLSVETSLHGASVEKMAELKPDQVKVISEKLPFVGESIFSDGLANTYTVLGYIWEQEQACRIHSDALSGQEEIAELKSAGFTPLNDFIGSLATLINQSSAVKNFPPLRPDLESSFYKWSCPVTNRSGLAAKSSYQGFFNAIAEDDGIFRRIPLVFALDPSLIEKNVPKDEIDFLNSSWIESANFFPSLSFQSVLAYLDRKDEGDVRNKTEFLVELDRSDEGHAIIKGLKILRKNGEEHWISLLPDGTMPLRFYGSQRKIPYPIAEISLATITEHVQNSRFQQVYGLDPELPLKDHIVLIGPTAMGVYDLRPNSVQGDAAGVFLHATATARLLDHIQNKSPLAVKFSSLETSLAFLWVFGLILALVTLLAPGLQGAWSFVLLIAVFLGTDYYFFTQRVEALDSISTLICLIAVFASLMVYKYLTEEKERAFVKGAFEKYVSPDVVGSILKDPKKLNLGGERRELSVLFSDVRGFTTISEAMGAAELAKFMNDYLTPMTEIVLENRGTIDKYMGDAIMAIFGAPIPYENHPEKAVDAGLLMLEKLDSMKPGWKERGLPPIEIGVGVNTGEMSVGNMGSTRIFSYTVMGDSVNLGSRLEGLTKEYGVRFIISEFTHKYVSEIFTCRELDRVKVKGKTKPVTIYEVLGRGQKEEWSRKKEYFERALALYYSQNFTEAQKIFESHSAEDPTAEIYAKRCALWLEEAPGDDWDGSWTMKSK